MAGVDQHLAQGINLLYFLPAGLLALPAHIKNGYVEKKALLPCIAAGLTCAALCAVLPLLRQVLSLIGEMAQ